MEPFLTKIDLFGYKYNFKVFGEPSYKTLHGGICTVILLILSVFTFFLFSSDFIYKTNPKSFKQVNRAKDLSETNIKLSNANYPIIISFQHQAGTRIPKENLKFHVIGQFMQFKMKEDGTFEFLKIIEAEMMFCKDDPDFRVHEDKFDVSIEHFLCFDFKEIERKLGEYPSIEGDFNITTASKGLVIEIRNCGLTTNGSRHCFEAEETAAFIGAGNDIYNISMPVSDISLDSFDSPISMEFVSNFKYIGPNFTLQSDFYIKNEILNDDRGWIFEEKHSTLVYSFSKNSDKVRNTFIFRGNQLLAGNYFIADLNITTHYRSFIKIQEVFANIGGILKVLSLILGTLSKFAAESLLKVKMASRLYRYDEIGEKLVPRAKFHCNPSISSNRNIVRGVKLQTVLGAAPCLVIMLYKLFGFRSKALKLIEQRVEELEKQTDIAEMIEDKFSRRIADQSSSIRS